MKRKNLSVMLGVTVLLVGTGVVMLFGRQQQEIRSRADGFVKTQVVTGLTQPTAMEFAPDGRLFVLEKSGKVRIVKDGSLLSTPFLTLSVNATGERGLLGIAFDPQFASNRFVYLYYTTSTSPIHNRVSRFTANGDTVVAGSEVILLDLDNLSSATNHNGGAIHFGTDGKLYIAVGDNATGSNAQTLNNTLGKLLRINSDGSIPSDNPFFTSATGKNRAIWVRGLRNPYTFAVNPASGVMYLNDVGEATWEEVNQVVKGANYGWPTCEGSCSTSGFTNPIHQYDRSVGSAITGGTFYEANQFPATYKGKYFFSDYTKTFIRQLDPANKQVTVFRNDMAGPVDLKVGPDGCLYVLSISQGKVDKISWTTTATATPTRTPTPTPTPTGTPPVGTITAPTNTTKYNAGQTISYSATGTDAQDGTLPASAFSWTIVFHHDTHTHPFLGPINGVKSGSFQIPQAGETASNTWYRVQLTVKDSGNLQHTSFVDVTPNKANFTLATNPSGLQITLDGQPKTAPFTETGVVGFTRTLGVVTPQTVNGKTYNFASWSDGKPATHTITTAATATTYTANFVEQGTASTKIGLNLLLHGVGNGGDSVNPNTQGNMAPVHQQRTVTVDIVNQQNQTVLTKQGTVAYNSAQGNFTGSVDLGTTLPTGFYQVKVKTNQYLRSIVPGIHTITAGTNNQLPQAALIVGDANGDNALSILDYSLLVGCYSDFLPATNCTPANKILTDLNDDGNVNLSDFNLFLRELSTRTGV
jgi:glucose/arabinose dehydrogenase